MIEQLKLIKVRRFIAYFLDYIILSIFSSIYIFIGVKIGTLKYHIIPSAIIPLLNLFIGIMVSIAYYLLFWSKLKLHSTPGQLICKLKIKVAPTIKQCIKRVLFMNAATMYFWVAATYVISSGRIQEDMQPYCMLIILLSTLAIQIIYAYFINGVDKVTGIKVVDRQI